MWLPDIVKDRLEPLADLEMRNLGLKNRTVMYFVLHGLDLSASALEEAKEQWEKHCRPFPATFQELDPCTVRNSPKIPELYLAWDSIFNLMSSLKYTVFQCR